MSELNENARPRVTVQHFATNDERTIKRLRAELAAARKQRDEARRDACAFEAINQFQTAHPNGIMSGCAVVRIARQIATERGWDCFAQKEGGGA